MVTGRARRWRHGCRRMRGGRPQWRPPSGHCLHWLRHCQSEVVREPGGAALTPRCILVSQEKVPRGEPMFRFACYLFAALAAYAATPLYQTSVEKSNWTAVQGIATPDAGVLHGNNKSLRLEAAKTGEGMVVRFAPIPLTIGKRYELSGWVRTRSEERRVGKERRSRWAPDH